MSRLKDVLADPDTRTPIDYLMAEALTSQTEAVLKTLTPREEHVVRLRFGIGDDDPRTLEDVGRGLGVTRERIRQIEAQALRKLRQAGALAAFQVK